MILLVYRLWANEHNTAWRLWKTSMHIYTIIIKDLFPVVFLQWWVCISPQGKKKKKISLKQKNKDRTIYKAVFTCKMLMLFMTLDICVLRKIWYLKYLFCTFSFIPFFTLFLLKYAASCLSAALGLPCFSHHCIKRPCCNTVSAHGLFGRAGGGGLGMLGCCENQTSRRLWLHSQHSKVPSV